MQSFRLTGRDPTSTARLDLDVERQWFRLTFTGRDGRDVVQEGQLSEPSPGAFVLRAPRHLGRVRLARYLDCDALCIERLHGAGRTWTPELWHPPLTQSKEGTR